MAGFDVISDVSKTLANLLLPAMDVLGLSVDVQVHDLQVIPPNASLLTLFLYEVVEDPSARNRPRRRAVDAGSITISKPPMALLLRYLLTAWNADQGTNQNILGRALQVLYETPILSGPQLTGELAKTDVALKITLAQLSLEERARAWHAIQKPYRLSLVYEVRVVPLDVESVDHIAPVSRRSLGYETPGVDA
ncbi:MAG TPA: DUF4255 domain-containing protein [Blastocatellia bacterium]|nr:DUF4255 domain-containing protein [Blastocatellia bacterium]